MAQRTQRELTFAARSAVFVLALLTAACGSPGGPGPGELAMAPESALPDFVRAAPTQVREAYRFAVANRELLSAFPCYCGCGSVAHRNNLDCYVKTVRPDGTIEFENHALG